MTRFLLAVAFGASVITCAHYVQSGADWRPVLLGWNAGWTFIALVSKD
jgi:hypothetical protein